MRRQSVWSTAEFAAPIGTRSTAGTRATTLLTCHAWMSREQRTLRKSYHSVGLFVEAADMSNGYSIQKIFSLESTSFTSGASYIRYGHLDFLSQT